MTVRSLVRVVGWTALVTALAIAARRILEKPLSIPSPGTRERDTIVDGVRWRSRELPGSGPETVVFVHGFLSSSATWKRVLGPSSGGRVAISVDLPGSGFSDRPWPNDYTVGGAATGLLRFLDARGIDRAILVGNSLGGAVCMMAATAQPRRFTGLVVADSPFPGSYLPWSFRTLRASLLGDLQIEFLTRPVMAFGLRHRLYADARHVTEETIDDWWLPVRVPGTRRAALAAVRTPIRPYEGLLERIDVPTLVLWGKEDRLLPPEDGLRLAQKIRDARLVLLPGAGHLPQEETPGDFAKAVSEFLASLTTRR